MWTEFGQRSSHSEFHRGGANARDASITTLITYEFNTFSSKFETLEQTVLSTVVLKQTLSAVGRVAEVLDNTKNKK